eukprot:GGOE01018275.1.p1 GENE.GGOE01018275.1~~GGOE01018275.1.p1  ORF type:complete len:331 (+),score=44.66 GGOE01018275.1:41-1033(+)
MLMNRFGDNSSVLYEGADWRGLPPQQSWNVEDRPQHEPFGPYIPPRRHRMRDVSPPKPKKEGPSSRFSDEELGQYFPSRRQWEHERPFFDAPHPPPVVDLNPGNFNRVVLDPARTVVVIFYAHWCKAAQIEKLISQLQEDLTGEYGVTLAQVDVDQYKDIFSHFDGSTLPCVMLFPMENKKGMEYSGPRTESALLEFIIFHHRGEVVKVPHRPHGRPDRSDFPGVPAPVSAPPKTEDYPYHPFDWYIPLPPPPATPEVAELLQRPFRFDPASMPPLDHPLPPIDDPLSPFPSAASVGRYGPSTSLPTYPVPYAAPGTASPAIWPVDGYRY